jgi:hypothetical protein
MSQFIKYPLGDTYDAQFTARRSWMANLYYRGKQFDVVPATWRKDLDLTNKTVWVHFTSDETLTRIARAHSGFDVVVMEPKEYHQVTLGNPLKFDQFVSLYRVQSTGKTRSGSKHPILLCDLLRRLYPRPAEIYRW